VPEAAFNWGPLAVAATMTMPQLVRGDCSWRNAGLTPTVTVVPAMDESRAPSETAGAVLHLAEAGIRRIERHGDRVAPPPPRSAGPGAPDAAAFAVRRAGLRPEAKSSERLARRFPKLVDVDLYKLVVELACPV